MSRARGVQGTPGLLSTEQLELSRGHQNLREKSDIYPFLTCTPRDLPGFGSNALQVSRLEHEGLLAAVELHGVAASGFVERLHYAFGPVHLGLGLETMLLCSVVSLAGGKRVKLNGLEAALLNSEAAFGVFLTALPARLGSMD